MTSRRVCRGRPAREPPSAAPSASASVAPRGRGATDRIWFVARCGHLKRTRASRSRHDVTRRLSSHSMHLSSFSSTNCSSDDRWNSSRAPREKRPGAPSRPTPSVASRRRSARTRARAVGFAPRPRDRPRPGALGAPRRAAPLGSDPRISPNESRAVDAPCRRRRRRGRSSTRTPGACSSPGRRSATPESSSRA